MTADNPNDRDSTPADQLATQADARLREWFSSPPVCESRTNVEQRVMAKLSRRKLAIRGVWVASLIMVLTAGWCFRPGRREQLPPLRVAEGRGGVKDPSKSIREFELFASAYSGMAPPVVQFETLDNESSLLLGYLESLETTGEKQ